MPNPARKLPAYEIELPVFTGPLDLLLHLIEREELDITAISLVRVTEQYLEQVGDLRESKIEHLIDFLFVGARLVLIKSRALLPKPPAVPGDEEEEEDPAEALLRQLRQYKRFKQAAGWLQERRDRGLRTYLRVAPPPKVEAKPDLAGVTMAGLLAALKEALARAEAREESVDVVEPRRLTIEGQLRHVLSTLKERRRADFRELLSTRPNTVEVAVTLLAILELIKRREVVARQTHPFGPIEIEGVDGAAPVEDTETAPAHSPTSR